jgi:predicted NBD/HSP70 family sugar kinase
MTELMPERAGLSAEDFAGLVISGDVVASGIVADAGRLLGRGLATLGNLYDPEVLVIGGEGVRFGELLFGPMRQELNRLTFAGPPTVAIDAWGDDAWARGAAGLAIQQLFDFEAAQAASADMGPSGGL